MTERETNQITIKTDLFKEKAMGMLEVSVFFTETLLCKKKDAKWFLWAQLNDREGRECDRIFPVCAEKVTQFCMQVDDPVLWNPEEPYLYEVVLELRDADHRLLGCTGKKVAFYTEEQREDAFFLNGCAVKWRVGETYEQTETELKTYKRGFYNAILFPWEEITDEVVEQCLGYGLFVFARENFTGELWEAPVHNGEMPGVLKNPDFELNVTNRGVLIENRSIFVNVNEYELIYEVYKDRSEMDMQKPFSQGMLFADVPPGTSRYLELSFEEPEEPGTYLYKVALRMRKNMAWAKKGEEIVSSAVMLTKFFKNEEES